MGNDSDASSPANADDDDVVLPGQEETSLRRSSRKSARTSYTEQTIVEIDVLDMLSASTPNSREATPDDTPLPVSRIYGGFKSLTWTDHRQNTANFAPKYCLAKDLPHELQDHINWMTEASRQEPRMRHVLESSILEHTAEDEPDAPPIVIINEVDSDPTPPWEFHYSNKMWHGEGVPPPDMENLVGCDCVGKCDPRSKTCKCLAKQRNETGGVTPDFMYDPKGKLKLPDYPIYECNDLCGCGDGCRNRVGGFSSGVSVLSWLVTETGIFFLGLFM